MVRIEKAIDRTATVLRISGRIQEEYLSQLWTEIERCADRPKLDLSEVTLLDRSSVLFLVQCEAEGIQIINCSLYIQEWMSRERRRMSLPNDSE
jgi:ABC-type transporter Mla MlaB component